MVKDLEKIALGSVLKVWGTITILLLLLSAVIAEWFVTYTKFTLTFATINFILFFIFCLFAGKIELYINRLIDELDSFSVSVFYEYEKKIGTFLLAFLSVFVICIIYVAFYDVEFYFELIDEDNIIEYSSSLFWFLSFLLLSIYVCKSSKLHNYRYLVFLNSILLIFFILCCGEEISWGQRFFNFETPEIIKAVNVQEEVTIHNIGSISIFMNIFFISNFVFFAVLPFLSKGNLKFRRLAHYANFPLPSKVSTYVYAISIFTWIIIGLRFGTLGFHPFSFYAEQYYTQMDDELYEFLASYSFFSFSLVNLFKKVKVTEMH